MRFSRVAGYADPPSEAGFCLWVLDLSASRKSGPHAPDCAHIASLPDYRQPINQPRYPLVRKATLYPDDIICSLVFFESEQSKNGAAGWCRSMLRGGRTWGLMTWPCSNVELAA